jgi:small subunit ribosomal protein S23e/putative transcription factor
MSKSKNPSVVLTIPIAVEHKPLAPIVYEEATKPLATVTVELKTAIQQARIAMKLSQKDLAGKMCVPVSVIHTYENGTAIPTNAFIAQIEKVLKTKLPRLKKVKAVKAV